MTDEIFYGTFRGSQSLLTLSDLRYIPKERMSMSTTDPEAIFSQADLKKLTDPSFPKKTKEQIIEIIASSYRISDLFKYSEYSTELRSLFRQEQFRERWSLRLKSMGREDCVSDPDPFGKLMGAYLLHHFNRYVEQGKAASVDAGEIYARMNDYLGGSLKTLGVTTKTEYDRPGIFFSIAG